MRYDDEYGDKDDHYPDCWCYICERKARRRGFIEDLSRADKYLENRVYDLEQQVEKLIEWVRLQK